jgi:hypothetical protein
MLRTGAFITAFLGSALLLIPLTGQPVYHAPRTAGGKPDLNGIWQALNEANYDIEAHAGAIPQWRFAPGPYGPVPAAPVLALGAVGSVPPSLGVVEGGEIPYKPEALAKKKENQQTLAELPIRRSSAILPGVPRATYMPYPFQIFQSNKAHHVRLRVRRRRAQHLSERSRATARRLLDGTIRGSLGRERRW